MPKSSSVVLACSLLAFAMRGEAALTGSAQLAAVYDAILSAQFDRADAELAHACPPAPIEACQTLDAVSMWWQIQIDPVNHSRDRLLKERANAAIASAEAWTRRDPRQAEAWFYLAGAYGPLVQWQVLRGERVGAARNGNKIRMALEEALRLDPAIADAHFGIGLYQYYADIASAGAKVFRWLLFLPGGDRVKGLQAIDETRTNGALLRAEAEYQRHLIDIWYEHKPAEAITLLQSLDARYPTNPLFLQRLAETYDEYLHDRGASIAAWEMLIDRARRNRVYDARRIMTLAGDRRRAIVTRDR